MYLTHNFRYLLRKLKTQVISNHFIHHRCMFLERLYVCNESIILSCKDKICQILHWIMGKIWFDRIIFSFIYSKATAILIPISKRLVEKSSLVNDLTVLTLYWTLITIRSHTVPAPIKDAASFQKSFLSSLNISTFH